MESPKAGKKKAIRLPVICGGPITAKEREERNAHKDLKHELPVLPFELRRLKLDLNPNVCLRPAGYNTEHSGSGYCWKCEIALKKKPEGTPAALRRLHEEVVQKRQFMGQHIDINPHDAIMTELRRSAGTVAWFEERIKEIGNDEENGGEQAALQQFTKMGVMPSNWMVLYQWERKHMVDVASLAIKAGVAERQVRLAEQHGQLLALAISNFLRAPELALTPQQQGMAPQIMSKILLSLPMGSGTDAQETFIEGEVVE